MIELSRRALLQSALAFSFYPKPFGSIVCSLAESKQAFGQAILSNNRLIVESSVGFEKEDLSWLALFGFKVHAPVPVTGPSYIRYCWPQSLVLRDFSRVSPVSGGIAIAHLGSLPVAARSPDGRILVLGSPIGPHLYAGDTHAVRLWRHLADSE